MGTSEEFIVQVSLLKHSIRLDQALG